MSAVRRILLIGTLAVLVAAPADAQRMGFSIGIPSSSPTASGASAPPHQPTLPPLPRPLPSPSAIAAGRLQPLDLTSTHMVPPRLDLSPSGAVSGRAILPQLPFALD